MILEITVIAVTAKFHPGLNPGLTVQPFRWSRAGVILVDSFSANAAVRASAFLSAPSTVRLVGALSPAHSLCRLVVRAREILNFLPFTWRFNTADLNLMKSTP
jgi:hypothetical protein